MSAPYVNKAVEVMGLKSRADLNGKQGFAVSFDASKGRYNVRLADGMVIALKPANLKKVEGQDEDGSSSSAGGGAGAGPSSSFFGGAGGNPDIQRQLEQFQRMLAAEFPGLTPKQIGMTIAGLVVLEIFIIFYFGFMRGAWTFLFFLMCSGAIAPAYRTFRRSGPRAAAEQFGGFINKKIARFTFARGMPPLIAAALPIVLFAVVFAFVLGPSSASSGASASATASRAGLSSADIESFYSLGYEDAQLNRPFGTSLPSSSSEADFDDAPPRPPAGPRASSSSSFGFSKIILLCLVGKQAFDLGKQPGGGWNPQLALANVQALPTWRKVMMGFLLLRLLGLSPV